MPTIKQKNALKKMVENGGKPISKIMKDVGYSPNTARSPKKLTNSKGWNELLEKYLPDDKLLRVHDEALQANRVISAKILTTANGQTDDFIEVPDTPTRLKAVELGYKVKKKLGPEVLQQFNVGGEMTLEFIKDEK